ncbi:SusD/RagB family nutrient-binding outer membrane lipoprotein [Leptobacterium flavescens]|uniref:SusD/RagB family nutrient-binding outer membrane lipoprotein n=1 Tax=Leptobacterium flavescens TaxID=472055 RepID=A0A6P0UHW4_9FLAO|nr:SusD/RagB family nutrient-binding outer membrane lipoprotein [Leptobacterium flavescens]NER12834.1 SusD/RagB family nutrient-binding outer membrane lipoprotein [Leptobacterium flavescens]
MKAKKSILGALGFLFLMISPVSCTKDFEDINTDPVNPQSATTEGIMAGVQYFEFAEPRFLTWRGNLIYSNQFSHQFSYNAEGAWFAGDAYQNNQGWTNAMFDASYQKVSLNARNLLGTYIQEGDTNGVAVARIMMSWFYQKMTDIFGAIPYSDVIGEELILQNPQPSYDSQRDIYMGIINDLTAQMDAIGSSTTIIGGASGDYLYQGDPQKWRTFANTLRLRMALRARAAFIQDGDQAFIDGIINDCLSNSLIDETNQALLNKSTSALILSFLDGGFEDIYWGFGGVGSKWVFSDRYMNMLNDNNDPRRGEMADPSPNDTYNGAPVSARALSARDDLAIPSAKIIGTSTTDVASIVPTQILTAAESYFLQAEAALLGYGGGNAQGFYEQGIRASMNFWGVDGADTDQFINNETIATLAGSVDEQLNMVWNQRWLALLMNGYEAWALVRRTNLIDDLTDNTLFFVSQPNAGVVPRRLMYSSTELVSNEANVNAAINSQGPDEMTTNLWWDVD